MSVSRWFVCSSDLRSWVLTSKTVQSENCSFYTFGEGAVKRRIKFKKKERHLIDCVSNEKYIHSRDVILSFLRVCLFERKVSYQEQESFDLICQLKILLIFLVVSLNNDWFNSNKLNSRNHGKFVSFSFSLLFFFFRTVIHFTVIIFRRKIITIESWMASSQLYSDSFLSDHS